MVEFLKLAGAKGVAFDLLFTDDSGRVEEDTQLAAVLKGSMPVVQAFVPRWVEGEEAERTQNEQLLRTQSHFNADRYLSGTPSRRYLSARLPAPEILEGGGALGSVVAEADSDTIFRRAIPGGFVGSASFLSLPFALYESSRPPEDSVAAVMSHADNEGKFLIRFHGPAGTYQTYSIHSVITWRYLGEVAVKGKQRSKRIFEPLDPRLQARMIATLPTFEDARRAFDKGDRAVAAERFAALEFDSVSRAYAARIEQEIKTSEESPPSVVWVLTEK